MKEKVLCLVEKNTLVNEYQKDYIWEQENWLDDVPKRVRYNLNETFVLTPLIDHLHSDKENGQKMAHYHVDNRFETSTPNCRIKILSPVSRVFPHLYKKK